MNSFSRWLLSVVIAATFTVLPGCGLLSTAMGTPPPNPVQQEKRDNLQVAIQGVKDAGMTPAQLLIYGTGAVVTAIVGAVSTTRVIRGPATPALKEAMVAKQDEALAGVAGNLVKPA